MEAKLLRRHLDLSEAPGKDTVPSYCMPKICLISWLAKTCQDMPCNGPQRTRRNLIESDLKFAGVDNGESYNNQQSGRKWKEVLSYSMAVGWLSATKHIEQGKPMGQKCDLRRCRRWFRKGGRETKHTTNVMPSGSGL